MSQELTNGEYAVQETFNDSFMGRGRLGQDTDTTARVGLKSVQANAGSTISETDGGIQRLFNALAASLGIPLTAVYNYVIPWASNIVGLSSDTAKARMEALTLKFRGGTGLSHNHNGSDGQGEKISANNLLNVNNFFSLRQTFSKTGITGGSTTITTEMTGKVAGGGASALGVITSGSYNRAEMKSTSNGDFFEDGSGNRVFARITESGGAWTATYYVYDAGVESAYSFPGSVDADFYFNEVFSQETRPTLSPDAGQMGSVDATADIITATTSLQGKTQLASAAPGAISSTGSAGTANASVANADHTHEGVHSVSKQGDTALKGDATFTGTGGTTLTQTGQNIAINSPAIRSGTDTIANAATSKAITFSSTLGTANYSVRAVLQNTTDASPMFVPLTVTAKSATGFTVTWNTALDSANYSLEWAATAHV